MNKLAVISALLLCSGLARATTVTATITDTPDAQTWNNGKCTFSLFNPRPDITPSVNGTALTSSQLNPACTINGSGVLSATVTDNSTINIANTTWNIIVSPNASAGAFTTRISITGSSANLTAPLSALAKSPRFTTGPNAFGYLDAEVITVNTPGQSYYNVTTPALRIWSGSAWTSSAGGAPTTCVAGNNYPCLSGVSADNTFTNAGSSGNLVLANTNVTGGGFAGFYLVATDQHTLELAYFGDSNGLGLTGSAGMYDTTNSVFIWSTNQNSDFCTSVPLTDVANCTSTPFKVVHSSGNVVIGGGSSNVFICSGGTFAGLLSTSSGACTGGSGTATKLFIQ